MERLSLREAADLASRSVTTLRRYIRSGRLRAEKRPGRFGPEYFVSPGDLAACGLPLENGEPPSPAPLAVRPVPPVPAPSPAPSPSEAVPASLFRELQMKHEQLLVQYGMMRVAGVRTLETQADLEASRREAEDLRAQLARVKERRGLDEQATEQRLRQAELELEGLRLDNAALREKVRGLEMITRNAITNETIDRQFSEVIHQARRVGRLAAEHDAARPAPLRRPPAPPRADGH